MNRMRSPNYPSVSLSQAVDLVAKVHKSCRSNVITREDAVREMGYSGMTGRSMKVLSALLQFGLLEKTGKGDVKVTQRAVDILHGIEESDRNEAMFEAAWSPPLFKSIRERFPDGIPAESAIRSFLIKQEFMDAAIGPAINSFKETYRAVQHIRESDSHGEDDAEAPESGGATQETPVQPQNQPLAAALAPASLPPAGALAYASGIPDLNKINMDIRGDQVLLSGLLDVRGLRLLKKRIESLEALLAPLDADDDAIIVVGGEERPN